VGVGQFAVQLATLGGAEVTALVSGPHRFESLAGFDVEPVSTLEESGPFDVVLDGVGGQVLMDAIHRLAPGGIILAYGVASGGDLELRLPGVPLG
jgi:NADPH2:quinone reductase